jgi:hypothetical protein
MFDSLREGRFIVDSLGCAPFLQRPKSEQECRSVRRRNQDRKAADRLRDRGTHADIPWSGAARVIVAPLFHVGITIRSHYINQLRSFGRTCG